MKNSRAENQMRFVVAVMRPVLRYCLRSSIKIQSLFDICKSLMIEEAEKELADRGVEVSVSRISVLTGVHRKDVSRLRGTSREPKRVGDLSARVLNRWENDARFTTQSGKPRVLNIEGATSEFVELVRSVSKELNPYTLLFELERSGAVERSPNGLKRKKAAYIAKKDIEQGLFFLETDSEDLFCSVEQNLFDEEEIPNLHVKTEYDSIPAHLETAVRKWLLALGESFHKQAREYLADLERTAPRPQGKDTDKIRVAVATYSRIEGWPRTKRQEHI